MVPTNTQARLILPMLFTALVVTSCVSKHESVISNESPSNLTIQEESISAASSSTIGRHYYASVGVGAGRMLPDASGSRTSTLNDRVESGAQMSIGLDINRQFSVELHSADLGSAGFSPGGRINYHIHGGSVLHYFVKNRGDFKRKGPSAFARMGLGYMDNSSVGDVRFVTNHATQVLFGVGVQYVTRSGLGVRAEAIAYQRDALFAQLGLIYRTGRQPPAAQPILAPALPAIVPQPVYDPCENLDEAFEQVNFHTASSQLTDKATRVLQGVAIALSTCKARPVTILAHTDWVGTHAYNRGLSSRRAKSVMRFLYAEGVAIERMKARGFGETKPIATNKTAEGRRRNRRVELILH